MSEIQNYADALQRITNLYNCPVGTTEDYAHIAYFLSNGRVFTAAIDSLSERLWDIYRRKSPSPDVNRRKVQTGNERNKFTGTLRLEGLNHGFGLVDDKAVDTRSVILVGAISGSDYLERIRRGLFFKDMMDLKHGEHTHTFQWLAIACSLNLQNNASFLYKNIYNVRPKPKASISVPGIKLIPKEKRTTHKVRGNLSFWSWLVDCFPVAMAGQNPPAGESIFTDGYRCPQNLNKYLIDKKDDSHFLANYLQFRYRKRNWFTEKNNSYDAISGGATSKNYGNAKQPLIPQTKALGSQNSNELGGYERNSRRSDYTKEELAKKNYMEVTFHGVKGMMANPYI